MAVTGDTPQLKLTTIDGRSGPAPCERVADLGIDPQSLRDLILKLALTVPSFTTEAAAQQLCLPFNAMEELCWRLKQDHLLEILGQEGAFNYRYSASKRGREQARELMQICGYIGPAPVSLASYIEMLQLQMHWREDVTIAEVEEALDELVLSAGAQEVAALAVSSSRSLFVFGPAGNGKTTLGKLLHQVHQDQIWIPHCIDVGSNVVRLFDQQMHRRVDVAHGFDTRWVCIDRPLVVVGGEMTMAEMDLAYSPSLRYYEAPPHVKANGGTFLIDDFGRQRVPAHELLNRWIVPLESRVDYLSLHTGQRIEIPFLLFLIVATNLDVADVADPAFLRRIGYRLHLDYPSREDYCKIFIKYAKSVGATVDHEVLRSLVERYRSEGRQRRASEPRDLVERARDICRLRRQSLELTADVLDAAWRGYFG